jgi:hypothetical protein
MSVEPAVRFFRRLGYQAEAAGDCLWYRVPEGFLVRHPHHAVRTPAPAEIAGLLGRHRALGLRYSLPAGQPGQPGGVYLVRDKGYDLAHASARMRTRIRRGLEQCSVRRVSFAELRGQGLPLNVDTLARQNRPDAHFTSPARWARWCEAAAACESLHAWGAFAEGQLAAYAIVLQMGTAAIVLYQMSATALREREANPALNFALTYHLARAPGITAVSFGHVGLDTTSGLDQYKRSLGYEVEPLTFVVWLRPVARRLLLNPATARVVAWLRRQQPGRRSWQKLDAVLAIAARSASGGGPPRPTARREVDRAG